MHQFSPYVCRSTSRVVLVSDLHQSCFIPVLNQHSSAEKSLSPEGLLLHQHEDRKIGLGQWATRVCPQQFVGTTETNRDWSALLNIPGNILSSGQPLIIYNHLIPHQVNFRNNVESGSNEPHFTCTAKCSTFSSDCTNYCLE